MVRVEQRKSRVRGRDFRFLGSAFVEFADVDGALKFMAWPEICFQVIINSAANPSLSCNDSSLTYSFALSPVSEIS